jgi:L-arabinose isomerase
MRTKVLLVHPYWTFWESSVQTDLRAGRLRLLQLAAAVLRDRHDVRTALVDSPAEAERAAAGAGDVHAIVVLSTMAVPSATTMSLLDRHPRCPVVVWGLHAVAGLPSEVTHSDITRLGATVGAPMVGSALSRTGRPFDVVLTTLGAPQAAIDAVRRAAAAGVVRRAKLLKVGGTLDGYDSVAADDDDLRGLGCRVVAVDPEEVVQRAADATADEVDQLLLQVREDFTVSADVDPDALHAALEVEVALQGLADQHGAAAGVMNCHTAHFRHRERSGTAPCLALGRLTTRGMPWTCTGDVVTAVAMLAVQALGHPTLYHEIEAVDDDRDEVLLANTGEHDLRLSSALPVTLQPDVWFTGDPLTGPCAQFTVPAGPATLVAFLLGPEPRWVTAQGVFTGRQAPLTGTPHAGFRFDAGPARQVWPAWAAAGVSHHSVATNAHVGADISVLALHLGSEHRTV